MKPTTDQATPATVKKPWIKPSIKGVPIFFECTAYAGAV
jgi:hypothetical protein